MRRQPRWSRWALSLALATCGCDRLIGADFGPKELTSAGSAGSAGVGAGGTFTGGAAGSLTGGSAGSLTGGSAGAAGSGGCEPGEVAWVTTLGVKNGKFDTGGRLLPLPNGHILLVGKVAGDELYLAGGYVPVTGKDYYLLEIDPGGGVVNQRAFGDLDAFVLKDMALQPASASGNPASVLFWGTLNADLHLGSASIHPDVPSPLAILFSLPVDQLFADPPVLKSTQGHYISNGPADDVFGGVTAAPDGTVFSSLMLTDVLSGWLSQQPGSSSTPSMWITNGKPDLSGMVGPPDVFCEGFLPGTWTAGPMVASGSDQLVATGILNGDVNVCTNSSFSTPASSVVALEYTTGLAYQRGIDLQHEADEIAGVSMGSTRAWVASSFQSAMTGPTVYADSFDPANGNMPDKHSLVGSGAVELKGLATTGDDAVIAMNYGGPLTMDGTQVDTTLTQNAAVVRVGAARAPVWALLLSPKGMSVALDALTVSGNQAIVTGRFDSVPDGLPASLVSLPTGDDFSFVAGICF